MTTMKAEWVLCVVMVLAAASAAGADTLAVDFDRDGSVQSGFNGFSRGSDTVTVPTAEVYASTLAVGGTATVTVDNSDGAGDTTVRFLLRGPVTGTALNELASDFAFDNPVVTFTTLKAGAYKVTTWHHVANYNFDTATISITDAVTPGGGERDRRDPSSGASSPAVAFATNYVVSDGVNPVGLGFGSSGCVINGLTLEEVTLDPTLLRVNIGRHSMAEEAGWQNFRRDLSPTTSVAFPAPFGGGSGGSVVATITAESGALDYRDGRGGSNNVFQSFVFNTGGVMLLTLSDLKAAEHNLTTYHEDLAGLNDDITISVSTDGGGSFTPVGTFAESETGRVTNFVSDGVNDVVVKLEGSANRPYLNGFEIEYVPEPATVGLLALGFAGLAARRRRRQG